MPLRDVEPLGKMNCIPQGDQARAVCICRRSEIGLSEVNLEVHRRRQIAGKRAP